MPASHSYIWDGLLFNFFMLMFVLGFSLYMITILVVILGPFILLAMLCRPLIRAIFYLAMNHFPWFIILVLTVYIFMTHNSTPAPIPIPTPASTEPGFWHEIFKEVKAEVRRREEERRDHSSRTRIDPFIPEDPIMEPWVKQLIEDDRWLDSQSQI